MVGVGHIGSVIASELAVRGNEVVAVDVDSFKVNRMKAGIPPISEPGLDKLLAEALEIGNLTVSTNFSDLANAELILITVGTPIVEGKADLSALVKACQSIKQEIISQPTIIIKSTVPPGTTRDVVAPIFNELNLTVGFVPERLAEGQAITEFRTLPMVIGGLTQDQTNQICEIWSELGFEVVPVENSTAAELVKLADNAWIDLNIAFGMELAKVCDSIGTDVLEVIRAANTLKKGASYVNILTPSVGVGGYCLTKDPYFLNDFAESQGVEIRLPRQGRIINESSPNYLLRRLMQHINIDTTTEILVLGLAFKNNSGDTRYSPAIEFVRELAKYSDKISWFDPLVLEHDVPEDLAAARIKYLPAKLFNVVVQLATHDQVNKFEIEELSSMLTPNGTFVDGRRFLTPKEIDLLKSQNHIYIGVGRGA